MKIKRILGALLFASMATAAFAQQAPAGARQAIDPATLTEAQIAQTKVSQALFKLAALYKQSGDLERLTWTLERLVALRPNMGDLKLALATTYAKRGEKSKTYDLLLSMQKQGLGYALSGNENFAKVADTKVWTYILEGLDVNLKSFGQGKVAFSLPAGDHLYESLAFDPQRKQLLVGSVRDGTIQLAGKDGKLTDFIAPNAENGLWCVYAMAVVPEEDALYVASTASVYFRNFRKEDYGKAGVFKFKLSNGKFIEKYLLEPDSDARTLSSIVAGKGGLVFAADGLRNQIYRLDGGNLKLMMQNPQLTSVRGLALDEDGRKLYFADYALGLFGIDLAGGKGFDLEYDSKELTLGGIDGLYWYKHALVAIEGGMSPPRIMRLSLDSGGNRITRAAPIDAANPEFKALTAGAIDGDNLYSIANSQRNEYGAYGTPEDGAKLSAVNVFRSDLAFNDAAAPGASGAAPMLAPSKSVSGGGVFQNVEAGSSTGPAR